jgi:hypothetical protein
LPQSVTFREAQAQPTPRGAEPQTYVEGQPFNTFGGRNAAAQTIANGRRAEPTPAAVIDFGVVERGAEAQSAGFPISGREAQAQPTARNAAPQSAGFPVSRRDAQSVTAREAQAQPTPRDAEAQSAGFPISARDAEAQSAGFPVSGRDAQSVTAREAQVQPTPRDAEAQSAGFPCCSGRDAGPEPTPEVQPLIGKRTSPTFVTSVIAREADAQPQIATRRDAQAQPTI